MLRATFCASLLVALPSLAAGQPHLDERAFLPSVTVVERWREVKASISEPQQGAPSLVALPGGGVRIYWNDPRAEGITSATSADGLTFVKDAGVRLANGEGPLECIVSHPWLVHTGNAYRMYYQANARCGSGTEEFRVMSAASVDGLTFVREGVRVGIGPATGLDQAAHGRALRLRDGTWRMYFSASFSGPPAQPGPGGGGGVLGASSADGLHWRLDADPVLLGTHDPAVFATADGRVVMFAAFMGGQQLRLESFDGYAFTPVSWMEFYDGAGRRVHEFGDLDVLVRSEGRLYAYGSGLGMSGVGVFEPEAE